MSQKKKFQKWVDQVKRFTEHYVLINGCIHYYLQFISKECSQIRVMGNIHLASHLKYLDSRKNLQ